MSNNNSLNTGRRAKNDEFYTQLSDIENELKHYKDHFKDKVVLCNCDDPIESNFFTYFRNNFDLFKIKKLITICYKNQNPDLFSKNDAEKAVSIVYKGYGKKEINYLKGDGDFNSKECVEILKEADIVVTNPPFSLFRDFITQLDKFKKSFLIIGPNTIIKHKLVFPLIKENELWMGYTSPKGFIQPDGVVKKFGNISWFTNLSHSKRTERLILTEKYSETKHPKYDDYDAIFIDTRANIPVDYDGVMAVPGSYLDFHNPKAFEMINVTDQIKNKFQINGKNKFTRFLIKKIK